MRRFRAPSSGLDKFFAAQFSAGYITNISGFDLRQAQVVAQHEHLGLAGRDLDLVDIAGLEPGPPSWQWPAILAR
jgi:hypothetical protein